MIENSKEMACRPLCKLERPEPRPTAARLSSGSLADFLARKDLADFLLEALLEFLANSFTHSVCNIFSYLKGTVS